MIHKEDTHFCLNFNHHGKVFKTGSVSYVNYGMRTKLAANWQTCAILTPYSFSLTISSQSCAENDSGLENNYI